MNFPKISVYITNKNYSKYLEKSVNSVINQSYKNWELFIIDDNSSDNSREIIVKLKNKFSFINTIFKKKDTGLQKIANSILKKCNGKYIIRLDADDWLHENALLLLLNKIENNNKTALVYGNYFYVNKFGKIIGYEDNYKINNKMIHKYNPAHGACSLIRVSYFKKVGGYSTNLKAQDGWDIWYKFLNKYNIENIQDRIFYYRQHKKSLSKNYNKILTERLKVLDRKSNKTFKESYSIAIVPIKLNYSNIKNLPFYEINGNNLIDLTIDYLLQSKLIKKVLITTSSMKVIKYIEKKKSKLNFKRKNYIEIYKRPKNFSKSMKQINKFTIHAIDNFYKKYKFIPNNISILSLHTVRKNIKYLEQAIQNKKINKFNSIISVDNETDPLFNYTSKGLKLLNKGKFDEIIPVKNKIYKYNGAFIVTDYNSILNNTIFNKNLGYIESPDKENIKIMDLLSNK